MKFACILSDGFEDMEALGTVAILRRAGIEIDFISVFDTKTVKGAYGTEVVADVMMKEVQVSNYDGILIPGGRHSFVIRETDSVLKLTKAFYDNDKWMMSLCAGPTVFGVLGLLDNKKYISFPGTEESMQNAIREEKQVVKDGNFITAKAAGAVFEFAFAIISAVLGKAAEQQVRNRIYYKD